MCVKQTLVRSFVLTNKSQFNPRVPGRRFPEVDPTAEDAPVLEPQVVDVEEGLNDGCPRLGAHPSLEELEIGAVAQGAVIPPMAAALALTNVETGKRGERENIALLNDYITFSGFVVSSYAFIIN